MAETLRIHYTRRQTMKLGEDFQTSEIGADWEFPIMDGANIDQEFGKGWLVLRGTVDRHFEVGDVPAEAPRESLKDRIPRQQQELQQRVFSGSKETESDSEYRTFASGTTGADIVEGEAVFLENTRIWEVKEDKTRTGKRFGYLRVGNKERIPTGYARVKSFEPTIINKMLALKEGDHASLWGHYESWMGRDSVEDDPATYMWDFVPERLEKS